MASQYGCLVEKPQLIHDYCGESVAKNRIGIVAFVQKGTIITGDSPEARTTALLAAESAGTAYIVRDISGADDGGAPSEGKGYGFEVARMGSSTFTLTITDPAVKTHTKFWKQMKKQGRQYDLYYFTPGLGFYTKDTLTISPTFPKTEDINTFQEISVTIRFATDNEPEPVEWDTDTLAELPELFDTDAIDFTAGTGTTVDADGNITFTEDAAGTATINAGVNVATVEVVGETDLPTGLTVNRTAQGATITGTPTVATPATTIGLLFKNATGIGATKTVTITVNAAA